MSTPLSLSLAVYKGFFRSCGWKIQESQAAQGPPPLGKSQK